MLTRIDAVLFTACTKFSHALQRATGLTNYFVARVGTLCAALGVVLAVPKAIPFLRHGFRLGLFLAASGSTFFALASEFRDCLEIEKRFLEGGVQSEKLQKYIASPHFRIFWVITFLVALLLVVILPDFFPWTLVLVLTHFGLMVFHYFITVDPLPPGKDSLHEWIAKLRRRNRPIFVEH